MSQNDNFQIGRCWKRRTVTLCSFNVLCKHYEPAHLPNDQCKFEVRSALIKKQLEHANADVVFLSECAPISWYRDQFNEKYDIVFMNKSFRHEALVSNPPSSHPLISRITLPELRKWVNDTDDGAAFMFRKGSVDVISCNVILVNTLPQAASPNAKTAANGSDNPELLPSSQRARQFATVAHLYHRETKNTFFVCGMHMKADSGVSYEAERVCHLKQVTQALNHIRQVSGCTEAPLFFCGDLNCDPQSATMQMLFNGMAELDGAKHFLGSPSPFVSAMKEMSDDGATEAPFTILDSSYGNGPWWKVLDYILFENSAKDRGTVFPVGYLTPPSVESYGSDAINRTGSDHIPLVVEFVLR